MDGIEYESRAHPFPRNGRARAFLGIGIVVLIAEAGAFVFMDLNGEVLGIPSWLSAALVGAVLVVGLICDANLMCFGGKWRWVGGITAAIRVVPILPIPFL